MNNFYIKKLDKKDFDNLNSQKLKLGIFVKVEEGGVFAVCNRSTSYYIKNPAGYFCIAYGLWTPAGLLSSENYAHGGFLHSFYTSERFREQGLASKLLESNLEDIKSNGLGIASISTKKNNHPMNHILKKFGFKEMFVTIDSVLYYEKEL